MPQEGDEIREGQHVIELGGVDHRHPHIADPCTGLGFEKERILAMEDREFQAPFDVLIRMKIKTRWRGGYRFSTRIQLANAGTNH